MNPLRQRHRDSAAARLRTILQIELTRRKGLNPRYSLRALARSVDVEHSTLSQLLRGRRPLTWKAIRRIATRLRWSGTRALREYQRSGSLWDSRAIAGRLVVSIDEINVALSDLCLFGLIELKER
jgi:plasmid maintenance system antidote protein VapI